MEKHKIQIFDLNSKYVKILLKYKEILNIRDV